MDFIHFLDFIQFAKIANKFCKKCANFANFANLKLTSFPPPRRVVIRPNKIGGMRGGLPSPLYGAA